VGSPGRRSAGLDAHSDCPAVMGSTLQSRCNDVAADSLCRHEALPSTEEGEPPPAVFVAVYVNGVLESSPGSL